MRRQAENLSKILSEWAGDPILTSSVGSLRKPSTEQRDVMGYVSEMPPEDEQKILKGEEEAYMEYQVKKD